MFRLQRLYLGSPIGGYVTMNVPEGARLVAGSAVIHIDLVTVLAEVPVNAGGSMPLRRFVLARDGLDVVEDYGVYLGTVLADGYGGYPPFPLNVYLLPDA